jgi:hypothetical protein
MSYTDNQLLDEAVSNGIMTDVRVVFTAALYEAFMNIFGGYSPEDVTDEYCDEGERSYQMFYPIQDKVTEWLQDKTGMVSVIPCYTLHDEDDLSYCDIYIHNNYKDGELVEWSTDYDDTFGDKRLVI